MRGLECQAETLGTHPEGSGEPQALREREDGGLELNFGHKPLNSQLPPASAPAPTTSPVPAPMAVLAQLGEVGTMQGGITSQMQPPYILTHFPGCENSRQGAGRREEQVAAAAETLRALRYSPWAELFVLGLSAVCCEEVAEWKSLTCSTHLLLRSAQEGRQEMSPHHTDLPTVGDLRGHSIALVEKPEPGESSYLHWSQKTGSDLPLCPSQPRMSTLGFSKLHKDAFGPDIVSEHRVMSSRPEG